MFSPKVATHSRNCRQTEYSPLYSLPHTLDSTLICAFINTGPCPSLAPSARNQETGGCIISLSILPSLQHHDHYIHTHPYQIYKTIAIPKIPAAPIIPAIPVGFGAPGPAAPCEDEVEGEAVSNAVEKNDFTSPCKLLYQDGTTPSLHSLATDDQAVGFVISERTDVGTSVMRSVLMEVGTSGKRVGIVAVVGLALWNLVD